MRTKLIVALFVAVSTLAGVAGVANAVVPGWARIYRGTHLDVSACSLYAADALKSVTGKTPTRQKIDDYNYEIRGFTTDVGIFTYCIASPTDICPNRPRANLIILAFSSKGSGDAANKRNAVNAAFGDPFLIDCNW